jgi:hypothetical protein
MKSQKNDANDAEASSLDEELVELERKIAAADERIDRAFRDNAECPAHRSRGRDWARDGHSGCGRDQ